MTLLFINILFLFASYCLSLFFIVCKMDKSFYFYLLFLEFKIFTVSTSETDGYKRYVQSAEAYDLSVKVCLKKNI